LSSFIKNEYMAISQKGIITTMRKFRTLIWKFLKRLLAKGLIEATKRGSFEYYSVTEKGNILFMKVVFCDFDYYEMHEEILTGILFNWSLS
jgi:predicted transcriptional regulator